eukprot:m.171979 g.171979  ORF g.171979 m.171979 type:complete len:158 (+) comp31666_c5_seq1:153-626(+)
MADGQEFESADSGSSTTYPGQASACRKGSFLMVKERATKIIEMTISKTGKHGHAKCKFTCTDIFDGTKCEMLESSTHNVSIPNVTRQEYQLSDIADGHLELVDLVNFEPKNDIKIPQGEVGEKIEAAFNDNPDKDIFVTILSAIGREQAIDVKVSNS